MESIILTGFMGTGKSAVGKALAEKLSFRLIDTDAMIEERAGTSINKLFEKKGENFFRDLETEVIRDIAGTKNAIVITGGGAVIREINIENLRKCGTIVCLTATPDEIYKRIKDETHRPLLRVDDPVGKIKKLLEIRKEFYERSDNFVDTTELSVVEVADRIIGLTGN